MKLKMKMIIFNCYSLIPLISMILTGKCHRPHMWNKIPAESKIMVQLCLKLSIIWMSSNRYIKGGSLTCLISLVA